MTSLAAARDLLASFPAVPIAVDPSPVESLSRLRARLTDAPALLVKRDDALPFAFGGNKVRKLKLVAAEALQQGADTLITCGGVQSNHARVTAATAAKLGMRALLVVNGERPNRATANALLDDLFGAEIQYVPTREARAPAMEAAAGRLRAEGRRPFVIPLGASTPRGAIAFALAVSELCRQIDPPDAIVHATSSGGTQAGLIAGCRLNGLKTRVIGISADDPAPLLRSTIGGLLRELAPLLGLDADAFFATPIDVDDRFVGEGYGIPTDASREALALAARSEALVLDPTYTAKAMAGLIAYVRERRFNPSETVLFWHTGGQVALFA